MREGDRRGWKEIGVVGGGAFWTAFYQHLKSPCKIWQSGQLFESGKWPKRIAQSVVWTSKWRKEKKEYPETRVQRGENEIRKEFLWWSRLSQPMVKGSEREGILLDVEMNGVLFRKLFSNSFSRERQRRPSSPCVCVCVCFIYLVYFGLADMIKYKLQYQKDTDECTHLLLNLRLLMSYIYIYIYIYIYGAPILDVSRAHTTTHHSR